jgi:hypothetical protein
VEKMQENKEKFLQKKVKISAFKVFFSQILFLNWLRLMEMEG